MKIETHFVDLRNYIRGIESYEKTNKAIHEELVRFLHNCPRTSPDYERCMQLISSNSNDANRAHIEKDRTLRKQDKLLSHNISG